MSNPVLECPSEVYDAIVATIRAALDAGAGGDTAIGGYEDWGPSESADHQVLIEFGEAKPLAVQNDGRQAMLQEIILYAVISKGHERAALMACNLANGLARLADGNRWSLSHLVIDEPENIVAQPSFLIDKRDGHKGFEAWEVRLFQLIKYGADRWADDPGQTDAVIALAINAADPDDDASYQDIENLPNA